MATRATISLGSKSDDVKLAQSLLNRALVPSPGLEADGHFDDKTRDAVVAFQQGEGIGADGVVGPVTWKRLLSRAAPADPSPPASAPEPPPPAPAPPEPPVPSTDSELARRGLSVFHATRTELARGVEKHGYGNAWALTPNSGPIVDEYQRAAHVLAGKDTWVIGKDTSPWCGNFAGWAYRKAGFDMDGKLEGRLNSGGGQPGQKFLVFWSAVRLDYYFQRREGCKRLEFPYKAPAGKPATQTECKAWLEENLHPFGPRPGDVVLVDTIRALSHVCMVASYDPSTFELVTYEGNYQRRAVAARWDLSDPGARGFGRLNVIGRFPEADFTNKPEIPPDAASPAPRIEDGQAVSGRH